MTMTLTFSGTLLPLASNVSTTSTIAVLRATHVWPETVARRWPTAAGTFVGSRHRDAARRIDRRQDTLEQPVALCSYHTLALARG